MPLAVSGTRDESLGRPVWTGGKNWPVGPPRVIQDRGTLTNMQLIVAEARRDRVR